VSYLDFLEDERFPGGRGGLVYEANPWDALVAPRPGTFPVQLECIVADRPNAGNRIRLSSARDRHGVRRIMIDYRADPVDEQRLALLADRASEIVVESGASPITLIPTDFAEGSAHLHGTLRGGADSASSVTDPSGRCHDHDNLWVVDGGFFPSPGTLNPTLTIQANSRRIALAIR
jgi:paromamine 6'-oxidase/6'''-hydroxyneomycin C oxidase/2'-deamino-2'-hydroxyparomamine 6'-oxidase